jgi:methionyl-tRNA formyltransferase
MALEGVVLLAAPGPRAKAYLQALMARKLAPTLVVIMHHKSVPGPASQPHEWQGILFPNYGETLETTCDKARIPWLQCPVTSVNDPELIQRLATTKARLIIYCGPGGQLAGEALLSIGIPFLHLHSGWLPDYRGSTTLYYALLEDRLPSVTAFLLDRTIDTGPILARRQYPRPPAGMDVDHCYDPAIRADLLVRIMEGFATEGALPAGTQQSATEGRTYYVIHPILKHIALLSISAK